MLVGSAEVELKPEASGFGRAAASELRGERSRFAAAGRDIGRGFGTAAGAEGGRGLAEGTRRSEGRLRGVFGTLGRGVGGVFGAAAAVAAGAGLIGLLGSTISSASDLNETTSKTKVIFGDAASSVLKFADNSATAFGQSKREALDAASTFAAFGKSAGLSGPKLVDFSTGLTGLASDLASFNNTDPSQAIEAIGAALRGETEPIRAYNVLLDDATLRNEALRLGLIKTTKDALTPQQKVLAAQSAIYKQTKDAQGDFARTSGGLANQQRILSKQFENTKATLGQAFLPAATAVVSTLNAGLGPAVDSIKGKLPGLGASLKGAFSAAGSSGFGQFLAGLAPTLRDIGTQILGVLRPALSEIGGIIRGQLLPAFNAVLPVVQPVARFLLQVLGSAIVGALKGAVNVIKGVLVVISGIFNVFAGIFTGDWSRAWEGVKQIFSGAFRTILGAIQIFLNVGVLRLFRLGLTGIKLLFTGGWNAIKAIWSGALTGISGLARGAFNGIVNLVRGAASGMLNAIKGGLTKVSGAVTSGLGKVVGFFKELPGKIVDALSGLGTKLYDVGSNIIQSMIDGVKSMAGQIAKAAADVVKDAIGAAKRALGISSPSKVFAEIGRQTGAGLEQGMDGSRRGVATAGRRLAAAGIAASAVTAAALVTGGVRAGVPAVASVGAAARPIVLQPRIYIGDEPITTMVRVEMDDWADDVARAATGRQGD